MDQSYGVAGRRHWRCAAVVQQLPKPTRGQISSARMPPGTSAPHVAAGVDVLFPAAGRYRSIQPNIFFAIPATCWPWYLAMASSLALGMRLPSPLLSVEAP